MAKKTKLSDLRTQRQNANKHTDLGIKALDNAIAENGWIGAATIAANGETFDGSARLEVLKKRYGDDIDPIIVDCDGTRPVFVRRTDIANTDDPKAQLLSVQANRIAQIDLDWNPDVLADIAKRVKLSSVFEEEELTFIMSKEERASLVAGLKDKWEAEGVDGDEEVSDTPPDDDSGYSDDDIEDEDEELGDRVENDYSGDRAINGKLIESEAEKSERLAKDAAILADEAQSTIEILEQVETIQSRVKLGEIWALGRHRICCGDSTVEANVRALLGDRINDVGMVWSDPPYGISIVATNGYVGGGEAYNIPFGGVKNELPEQRAKRLGTANGSKPFGSKDVRGSDGASNVVKVNSYAPIIGDDTIDTAVKAYELASYIANKAIHIWWGANYYANHLPPTSCWIVWDKENTGNFADAELAWCSHPSAVRIFKHMWNGMVKASEHGQKRVHPTQKPIALCEFTFNKYGKPNDIIVDPFLGSAPSIIAAQKMEGDRTVYGFELSEDYCEVIIQRWEKFTGIEAKLFGSLPQ
jgi:hypothetical protein